MTQLLTLAHGLAPGFFFGAAFALGDRRLGQPLVALVRLDPFTQLDPRACGPETQTQLRGKPIGFVEGTLGFDVITRVIGPQTSGPELPNDDVDAAEDAISG